MNEVMSGADTIVQQVMQDFMETCEMLEKGGVLTSSESMDSYRRGYLDALSIVRYRLNNQEQ